LLNPTGDPVALADYYVSDSGGYAQVPSGGARVTASDFIARFPAAAVLSPGAVITVALDSKTAFVAAHGVAPTYSLRDGDLDLIAGSTDATLTNDGEVVVAFYWDGRTDLVTDVDAVHVGRPTASNQVLSKSDVAVDGPDADAIPSTYADDDRSMPLQPTAPASGQSTRRISTEPGHERQDGTGNGVDGDDETSEAIDATWSAPGTPTPGEHDL
jgi:hypothetical protein